MFLSPTNPTLAAAAAAGLALFVGAGHPVFALQGNSAAEAATPNSNTPKQIAIIGAGAGGASTAYHLTRFASEADLPINITVFEKSDRIGGRTLTVNAYNDPTNPVELGASIFVEINSIMWGAAADFGLPLNDLSARDDHGMLAVWDGEKMVYAQDDDSWDWWNLAKLFWKYGMAPYKTNNLMKQSIASFVKLYEAPYFPFRSLTERVFELGLEQLTAVTGEQLLSDNGISTKFAREIVQASTRVNYATNLKHIHGLETMVSMAPQGAVNVKGGNWRIFSSMLKNCSATCTVNQNTAVTSIALSPDSKDDGPRRYTIETQPAAVDAARDKTAAAEAYPLTFDSVVVATPWQFANITTDKGVLQDKIDEIPYVKLHVTLFTSPHRISQGFFKLEDGQKTPSTILTTIPEEDTPESGAEGAGRPGFYSISTLRSVTNPKTGQDEFLFKIFSPHAVTSEFLSSLLGVEVPTSLLQQHPASVKDHHHQTGSDETLPQAITWYFPHVFHSYPIEYPRVTFQDPVLGQGLYYTSGIESFISTMETSALMGKNVAKLVAEDLAKAESSKRKPAEEEDVKVKHGDQGEEAQRVLGRGEL